ncbi:DUF401 family protein [Marinitoga sp. 1138]|uniref:DUF401 family protein n=1 Tax=Marinitoga sp. 1138 TaxID=1643334 RepID=UPI001585E10E|nr:DUF401 family protein [Marinitoga sp. 1138]NUU96832.1 hypothetical protein [Marinitoga sp. 1138]
MITLSILAGFFILILAIKFTKSIHWGIFAALISTAIISAKFPMTATAFLITLKDQKFYEIIITIYSIYLIADTFKSSGNSQKFSNSIKNIFNAKQASALMPMFLGFLPMPGGAMFTAPMVRDISDESELDHLTAASMNYWFRHSMEFFWILYPALVLEAIFTKTDLVKILFLQLPIGIFAIVSAWFYFGLGKIHINYSKKDMITFIDSLIPIIAIIIGVLLKIEGWLVVFTVAVLYAIFTKNYKNLFKLKYSIFLLLFLVFWYKNFISASNLSVMFTEELKNFGINPWIIIIFSPFILGLITGITQAAFSITIPLTLSLATSGAFPLLAAAVTNYYFAIIGVLLSPVHLCLLLTSNFFGVKMSSMLKNLIIPFIFSFVGYLMILLYLLYF